MDRLTNILSLSLVWPWAKRYQPGVISSTQACQNNEKINFFHKGGRVGTLETSWRVYFSVDLESCIFLPTKLAKSCTKPLIESTKLCIMWHLTIVPTTILTMVSFPPWTLAFFQLKNLHVLPITEPFHVLLPYFLYSQLTHIHLLDLS